MGSFVKEVNPEMMLLARQSRGLSQKELAEKVSITPALLSKMENGIRGITEINLVKVANALDYPIEFFFNGELVHGLGVSEIYHRRRQNVPNKTLDKIHAQINIIRMSLIKMLRGIDIGETEFRVLDIDDFSGDVPEIARAVRAMWNIPPGPIKNLIRVIEYARGIVLPFDFGTRRIDSISYWPGGLPPLFFVNIDIPGDRLRFSLCHELGHTIMHQDYPLPDMERQADTFAAEFLMPEQDIRSQLSDATLESLALLKPYWKVSMAALLKRASDLGTITPRRARTLWTQMAKLGIKYREPVELDIPEETPSLEQEIVSVYSNEMGYSLSDLSKMLSLREDDVCRYFFGFNKLLRQEESEALIEEAENIIKSYQEKTDNLDKENKE
jgi:Zn-dependent peptidase ImmA (M78 family)/plasmid maintenance system antidote protein VapI